MNRAHYVMVYTEDLNESIKFYEEVIGLELKWQFGEYCGFTNGIILHQDDDDILKNITYFHVDDTEKFIDKIKPQVEIVKEPEAIFHGKIAAFKDNSGNILAVIDSAVV